MAAFDHISLSDLPLPVPAARVDIEDLPAHLPTIEAELEGGRPIELLRDGQVIAEIRGRELKTELGSRHPPMPDFLARLRRIYGNTPLAVDTTAWVREDRDGDEHLP